MRIYSFTKSFRKILPGETNIPFRGSVFRLLAILLLAYITYQSFYGSTVFADQETCVSCGFQISINGDFSHRNDNESIAIEGAGDNLKAFREEINGKNFTVTIEIPSERFRYWDTDKKEYIVEPGKYEILVTAASDDIKLTLPGTITAD